MKRPNTPKYAQILKEINKEDVRKAINKMKKRKALWYDKATAESWWRNDG